MGQPKAADTEARLVAKSAKRPLPPTVRRAVPYMRTGSALTLAIGIVLAALTVQTFRNRVADSGAPGTDSAAYQQGAVVGYIIGFVVWYLAVAGLWLWMAQANKAGKNWARITGSVLFGIYCLITFFTLVIGLLAAGQGSGIAMLALAATVLTWIIGLFTVILLWGAKSAQHFAPATTPHPAPGGRYRSAPPSTSTMDAIAPHQPTPDPWSTPRGQA